MSKLNRRQFLGAAAGAVGGLGLSRGARAQTVEDPRFLIVLAAGGGGSIIDCFMAIRASESMSARDINTFPDAEVKSIDGSPLRAVDLSRQETGPIPIPYTATQSAFVRKHKDDIMVATLTGTSVNHVVAQRRSITGNEAWNGRTMQEAAAVAFGRGYALPNVNMTGGGFIEHGHDRSIPAWAYNEPVASPEVWPVSLHGSRGLPDLPNANVVQLARAMRDDKLDPQSEFYKTFKDSPRLALWQNQRSGPARRLEADELIKKLMFLPNNAQIPLARYGLEESPDAQRVREKFPDFLTDNLHAQAALAYLLIKNRVSASVTISPSFAVLLKTNVFPPRVVNPPLAYDFSHNSHRAAQAIMWRRIFDIADGLIDLLKATPLDEQRGISFWDRSLIYMATDFGRDKRRPSGAAEWGTGHHLNNAVVVISPLANGNKILGGVDPNTGLTYGFDPTSGEPDRNRETSEAEIFGGVLHALGVDTAGSNLPDVRAMRKRA